MTKQRFKGMVNGEVKYKYATSSRHAFILFRRSAMSEFGKFKLTDLAVESLPGHYEIIRFNSETGVQI